MKPQKIINNMYKEMEEVKNKRLENFQNQLRKDFNKIRKKYERLLNFQDKK